MPLDYADSIRRAEERKRDKDMLRRANYVIAAFVAVSIFEFLLLLLTAVYRRCG